MKESTLSKVTRQTSPNPVSIVCSERPDGTTNLATVSWWTYLSFEPDMLAFAMAQTSYTGELVRQNKELILTIPSNEIKVASMQCGMVSGRVMDKVKEYGIEMESIGTSNIMIPKHSCAAVQCQLKEYIEVGDHYLYICNVTHAYSDKSERAIFAWKGYGKMAPAKVDDEV